MEYLRPAYKQINDTVHGYIPLTRMATEIIDTEEFKRLENLFQLGTCVYVFRGATHTRFEHSIGTYYLADRLCHCILTRTPYMKLDEWLKDIPELREYYKRSGKSDHLFDEYVIELVKISALCHDLGHGPLSHVFDDVFLSHLPLNHPMRHHEARSCAIFEKIISNHPILSEIICPDERDFVKSLIKPPEERSGFIYQIISNNLNGIDVDKCDYLSRDSRILRPQGSGDFQRLVDDVFVIDNIICYPKQAHLNVVDLFSLRYYLHKQMYCHKTVLAVEYMITDAMRLVDHLLHLTESILDLDFFCKLDEKFIINSIKFMALYNNNPPKEIVDSYELIRRINTRRLYRLIGSKINEDNYDIDFNRLLDGTVATKEDIVVHCCKIGYVSGDKNPLDNVYYYDRKDVSLNETPRRFSIEDHHQITLLPAAYQEHIMMVFYRSDNEEILKMLRINFQHMA